MYEGDEIVVGSLREVPQRAQSSFLKMKTFPP